MTTGRINQVTILEGTARRPTPDSPKQAEQFTVARSGQQPGVTSCGEPQSETWVSLQAPYLAVSGASYDTFRLGIQLPPLSSPQAGPQHTSSGARCHPSVSHTPRRRRIPGTRHIPKDGYRLRLAPKCLRINVDHRSVIHGLHQSPQAEAYRSSGASTGYRVLRQ